MDHVQSWLDAKEVRRLAEGLMAPPPEVDPTLADAGYGDNFEGFAGSSEDVQGREVGGGAQALQRMDVENSLAHAQKVAEGSGMLKPVGEQPAELSETGSGSEVLPESSSQKSPFQVSTHQDLTEEVPMAQQLSPPSEPVMSGGGSSGSDVSGVSGADANSPVMASKSPSFARGVSTETASGGSRGPFLDRLHQFSSVVRSDYGAQAMFLIDNDGQVILDEVENPKLIQVARTLANASYAAHRQSAGSAAVGNLHVKISANATLEVVPVHSRYGLLVLGVIFSAPLGVERVMQLTGMLENVLDPAV